MNSSWVFLLIPKIVYEIVMDHTGQLEDKITLLIFDMQLPAPLFLGPTHRYVGNFPAGHHSKYKLDVVYLKINEESQCLLQNVVNEL